MPLIHLHIFVVYGNSFYWKFLDPACLYKNPNMDIAFKMLNE